MTEDAYLTALAASLGTSYEPLDRIARADCPLDDDQLIQAAAAGLLPLRDAGGITWIIAPRRLTARRLASHSAAVAATVPLDLVRTAFAFRCAAHAEGAGPACRRRPAPFAAAVLECAAATWRPADRSPGARAPRRHDSFPCVRCGDRNIRDVVVRGLPGRGRVAALERRLRAPGAAVGLFAAATISFPSTRSFARSIVRRTSSTISSLRSARSIIRPKSST